MASIDLTPEEVLLVIRALAIEALRQRQLSSLEITKRNVNWATVKGHDAQSARIEQLKDRIIHDATSSEAAAIAAAAATASAPTATATDVPVRSGRGRRTLQPRQQD